MHLHGRIGSYQVLVPASSVLDVWSAEVAAEEAPTWRGRVVPYVDGRALLGEPALGHASALIAYGDAAGDPKLVILGLDQMLGSVSVTQDMLQPFPHSLADAHRLFDGIAALPGVSTGLLRLRTGLDLVAHAEIRVTHPPSSA
jgi:hypothetical protein